ncbi:MAG: hypothetical protein NVSMB25_07350 [Thermoleophilaceae bacterium]
MSAEVARRTLHLAALLLALGTLLTLPGSAAAAGFGAGAATIDISPRPVGASGDPTLASCPAAMNGPRIWADDEPYVDLKGSGHYDPGDPYCDANGNGRHDQIFSSGAWAGDPRPATGLHDPLEARAFAISDGGARVHVVVSVVAQGLFQNYTDQMASEARRLNPAIADVIVSANHNESSPDTVGIYGGPAPSTSSIGGSLPLPLPGGLPSGGSPVGLQSGIDDYYMQYLVDQVAKVAATAARNVVPATLYADQALLPAGLRIELSDNWPTTDNDASRPAAIDPKVGVLEARRGDGRPIFTVTSLGAHNQNVGHSGSSELSSDWPGYFERALEARRGGTSIFLVADNGSQEDPVTNTGSFAQAQATGEAFAAALDGEAAHAQVLRAGGLDFKRSDLCVPLENNLFKAAAGAGLFGQRPGYTSPDGTTCVQTTPPHGGPPASGADHLLTNVSRLDVGPDLQLLTNPGEAFPALMLGSRWGFEDVPPECQARANPRIPTWTSHAAFRFQVGLANDLIGYEIPPWAFIAPNGTMTTSEPNCQTGSQSDPKHDLTNPISSTDSRGHHHKLETEGIGPSASRLVADTLADLVAADGPDPSVRVLPGRFVRPDGSLSRDPAGAVGLLATTGGARALDPSSDLLVGSPVTVGFGARATDSTGAFMDFDGQPQTAPDITTRGMMVFGPSGCVSARYFLDVFPSLDSSRPLGRSVSGQSALSALDCARGPNVAGIQTRTASALSTAFHGNAAACAAGPPPRSSVRARRGRRVLTVRRGRFSLSGRVSGRSCRAIRVTLALSRRAGRRCRFVTARGRLSRARSCSSPLLLLARGTARWSFRLRLHVPRGRYALAVRTTDRAGRTEAGRRANTLRVRVR